MFVVKILFEDNGAIFRHDDQYVESYSERYGRAIQKATTIWELAITHGWDRDDLRLALG